MTGSIWMLYLAAYSGRSQSGESAGTFSMPSLTFTGVGSGVRSASWAATDKTAIRVKIRASDRTAFRRRAVIEDLPSGIGARGGHAATMAPDTVRITSTSSPNVSQAGRPPHPTLSPSGGEGIRILSLSEGEGRVRV